MGCMVVLFNDVWVLLILVKKNIGEVVYKIFLNMWSNKLIMFLFYGVYFLSWGVKKLFNKICSFE